LFKENISEGIRRTHPDKDLFGRLFILYFHKSTFKIEDDENFKIFQTNIQNFKSKKFLLLDFFISSKDLDSYWIILLENHVNSLLKQNVDNIDFKFASSESLVAIFKRNDLNLIETFFKNEISETPDLEAINKFINKPDEFYLKINFSECFKIIKENNNEKMAICLFKFFKYIYLRNNKDETPSQKEFSINFHLDIKQIFDKNWMNLFELILNDLNDLDYLLNDSIETSNSILKNINKSKNEDLLKNETTKMLVNNRWKYFPRFIYYFHFLLYFSFIISYSLNIEYYNHIENYITRKTVAVSKWYSFSVLLYFLIFEYLQLFDAVRNKEGMLYIKSFKNWFELIGFPFFLITLLISNSEWKSSFYSISILLAYWILIMRLDKFHYCS